MRPSGAATACRPASPGSSSCQNSSRRPPVTCRTEEVARNVLVSSDPSRLADSLSRVPGARVRGAVSAPGRRGRRVHRRLRRQGAARSWDRRHEDHRTRPTCGGRTRSSIAWTCRPSGRERRRDRRLRGAVPTRRLSARPRHHGHLVDAVLPDGRRRRRLRHHRLLRGRSPARHARRLRRVRPNGDRSRHARHRRPRRQPHERAAPLVRVRAILAGFAVPRLVRVARRAGTGEAGRRRLSRPGDEHLDARPQGRSVLPAPVLQDAARSQRRQPARTRRDRQGHGLLDGTRPLRVPGRCRPVPDRHSRHRRRRRGPARPACVPPGSCAPS